MVKTIHPTQEGARHCRKLLGRSIRQSFKKQKPLNFCYCNLGKIFLVLQDLPKVGLLPINHGKIFLKGGYPIIFMPNVFPNSQLIQKCIQNQQLLLILYTFLNQRRVQSCRIYQKQGFCSKILVKYFQFCRNDQKQGFCQ